MRLLLVRCAFYIFLFVALFLVHDACAKTVGDDPCVPHNRSVALPVHIQLIFAGSAPIFMRESWTAQAKQLFLSQLSGIIRHSSLPFPADDSPFTAHLPKSSISYCSVLEVSHTYTLAIARPSTASKLDAALSASLERSSSMFASGPAVADTFYALLTADPAFVPSSDSRTYNLLVYNAASVAPQRGYMAERGASAGTIGVATTKRFAFLDIGAKPHFLDNSATSTPGEQLMAASREPGVYANKMKAIVADVLTPPASVNMRRFPQESRLLFSLKIVDVSAVIGRRPGVAGDSQGNKAMGSTFRVSDFAQVIEDIFNEHVVGEKRVSLEVGTVDVVEDVNMAMAVARSFSMKGLEMVLDSNRLLEDVIANKTERAGYFTDSSFVAHVPMFLFSFADDSRITHFETGEELRAKVVGKEAVFLIENRLRDAIEGYGSTTSMAAKEVLELLCGLTRDELGYMNATSGSVPLLLRDIVRRNVLRQELDWSEFNAARKAEDVLNFEGLDSRLIPHEQGSAIAESRKAVRNSLRALYSVWDKAATSVSVGDIESVSAEVMRLSKQLSNKLHDEICNQPLSEEFLLKAADEVEPETNASPIWMFYLTAVFLPAVAGCLFGVLVHWWRQKKAQARGVGLGEIPVVSPRHHFEPPSTGLWFSTLTSSDKPKVN